jgi:pimeloyl-ACP methyl ester carboxylesterase
MTDPIVPAEEPLPGPDPAGAAGPGPAEGAPAEAESPVEALAAELAAAAATGIPTVPAGAAPIKPWPGELIKLSVGDVFVRHTPPPPAGVVGEPALYVHGLGGSALNWTDLMGALGQPRAGLRAGPVLAGPVRAGTVLAGTALLPGAALDLPGFGYSPPPADRNYSIDARAATVIALIEELGNGPVHLVGNSLGGAISTRVAARRPDLVRTLIIISPALPDLRPRLLPMRLALVSTPGVGRWLLNRMLEMPPEQRTDKSIMELFADPSRFQPARRDEAISEVIRRDNLGYTIDALLGSTRALVAEYTRPGPGSLWHDASLVTAPTLLIHGSHDRLVNPGMAGRAARTFRNCRIVVLPRTGHVAMMERPETVAAEIREFLAGVAEAGEERRGWLSRVSH